MLLLKKLKKKTLSIKELFSKLKNKKVMSLFVGENLGVPVRVFCARSHDKNIVK